jgi:hypothetical protein
MNKMKKLYITMMLILTGIIVEAQTSVWDGSKKLWTRGAGTENNPYLIESAENLAFLSYMVNKGFETQGVHFRLTTDIDLNGSELQPWQPIGLYERWFDEDGCDRGKPNDVGFQNTTFRGHFDGGGHAITNIYVDKMGCCAGLFGFAGGWDEMATIENVFIASGYIKGGICGGIVGNGTHLIVSHCRNEATIEGEVTGGIVGSGSERVINCSNTGTLSGSNVGGIIGGASSAEIIECYNDGNITATQIGGGILCRSQKAALNNCYNTGDVFVVGDSTSYYPYYPMAGGLVGVAVFNRTVVRNSYNVGEVTSNNYMGCLLGYVSSSEIVNFENCYYLNDCYESDFGTSKNAEEMRDEAFVNILNQNTQVWGFDENQVNDGFPILTRTDLSVNSYAEKYLTVYPNPAYGIVNIEGVKVAQVQVYNNLGQAVRTFYNTNKINTNDIQKGFYLLRLIATDGTFYSTRLVVQ